MKELRVFTDGENVVKMILPKQPVQKGVVWGKADIAALAERIESYLCREVTYTEGEHQYVFHTTVPCTLFGQDLHESMEECEGFARAISQFSIDVGWEIDQKAARLLDLKRRLIVRQQEAQQELAEARKSVMSDGNVSELCEVGTRHQTVAEAEQKIKRIGHELIAINATVSRIANGMFGICVSCGDPIAIKRLEALPMTPVCIDCAE
jgi:RNA polymerase-binding transcription factor DksA